MDKKTFIQKVVPMQAPMRLMAERMLRDNDAAADAVQEAFVQLWECRKRLDSIDNLEGYCLQTVRYRCVDVMRKRLPVVPIESAGEITDEEVLAESQMIEERSLRVEQLMSELNEREREVVSLRYFEGCSTEQLTQRLNLSTANLYTILSRAINKMKNKNTTL